MVSQIQTCCSRNITKTGPWFTTCLNMRPIAGRLAVTRRSLKPWIIYRHCEDKHEEYILKNKIKIL